MPGSKKIAIVHYRVGRTDGVSLEIEKRKIVLERMGHHVKLISGPIQNGADLVIQELEFDLPEIREIKENSFKYFEKNTLSSDQLMERIHSVARKIEQAFLKYHQLEKFDAILLHNIFSHGRHIAAAAAFARIVKQLNIPLISTNHDFYWERHEYQQPTNLMIHDYLNQYVPPRNINIIHVCINSLAQKEFRKRTGLDAIVLPDVFDFDQSPWTIDEFNRDFLQRIGAKPNDLIVLQATRIVERKGIELAIDFVKELVNHKADLAGKILYNGKQLNEDSEVIFVLAGYAEQSAQSYLQKLQRKIKQEGIQARFIHKLIAANRSKNSSGKIYTLWDAYVFADLVTYPSLQEGWGNQFIEAVFARKPIVLFEYPVFKADIKKEGYTYVSFGDEVRYEPDMGFAKLEPKKIKKAVQKCVQLLTLPKTKNILDQNFEIGRKNHGYSVLENFFRSQF